MIGLSRVLKRVVFALQASAVLIFVDFFMDAKFFKMFYTPLLYLPFPTIIGTYDYQLYLTMEGSLQFCEKLSIYGNQITDAIFQLVPHNDLQDRTFLSVVPGIL